MKAMVSGILVIDKPEGMTSHDVVNRVRLRFKGTKAGHLGTLDPMATGVLPICLGKATRLSQFLQTSPKEYIGEMRLGFSTTTYDRTGQPTSPAVTFDGSIDEVRKHILMFTGEVDQVPPPFSAKKIGGIPSYKLARRGRPISTPAVQVKIDDFAITRFEPPAITFKVVCSPGTYVRSLVHGLGRALGCGAHLTSLRRIRSGWFTDGQAVPFESVSAEEVIPLERLLESWVPVEISDADEDRIVHGNPVPAPEAPRQLARIINKKGQFLAVGILENGWVRPTVVLTSNTSRSTSDSAYVIRFKEEKNLNGNESDQGN